MERQSLKTNKINFNKRGKYAKKAIKSSEINFSSMFQTKFGQNEGNKTIKRVNKSPDRRKGCKSFMITTELMKNQQRSRSSIPIQLMSPQRKSMFPVLGKLPEPKTEEKSHEYRIRISSDDLTSSKNIMRTPQRTDSVKCYKFFRDSEVSNLESTSGSDTEQAKMPTFQRSSKVGLTPIPLMKKEDISKVFDSMKKQRKLINDPFFNASKADGCLDPIIQAYELGFIKQRKRSVINLKLHQIKESTRRSEAIQSVLEYTLKSGKDNITNDLKQLEKEIRVNKVEKSLFEDQTEGFQRELCFKSDKNIIDYSLPVGFDPSRRKSHKIDKYEMSQNIV